MATKTLVLTEQEKLLFDRITRACNGWSPSAPLDTEIPFVARGRTQLSVNGIAFIIELPEIIGLYERSSFCGIFGDYDDSKDEISNAHCVRSDDLLAVRRACLIIEEQRPCSTTS